MSNYIYPDSDPLNVNKKLDFYGFVSLEKFFLKLKSNMLDEVKRIENHKGYINYVTLSDKIDEDLLKN